MRDLLVIIGSTRPGRVGLPIGTWFAETATAHGAFSVRVADLAALDLPMMNEPRHPRLGEYQHEHTKAWSAMVAPADAIAIVHPEYNFAVTAPVVNAIDYLHREWRYKPAALVSYGGMSGGTRAAQMLKQLVTAVGMMPLPESVAIQLNPQYFADGRFTPPPAVADSTHQLLNELARWTDALKPLRVPAPVGASG
jgi:NAD(P)H-dependent FMN reductase